MFQDSDTTRDHNNENEETEPEIMRTDADTVKELVEMKFLTQRRNIWLRLNTNTKIFLKKTFFILVK